MAPHWLSHMAVEYTLRGCFLWGVLMLRLFENSPANGRIGVFCELFVEFMTDTSRVREKSHS